MYTPKGSLYHGTRKGSRPNTPLSGSLRTPLLAGRLKAGQGGSTPLSRVNIVEDTGSHILATWGSSLPVLVTEVLTLSPAGEVSVSLSDNGWAWLVSGRKLVVWRYTAGGRAQCRELALPPSDLAHRSELCAVYSPTPAQTPCCLAVSPEGMVRYWPSIAHEGSSTEISAELGGQECFSLTDVQPVGCVLATTTSTLVLIYHSTSGVACRRLQAPAGLLGGLGRRVSSLLWGSLSATTQGGECRLLRVSATRKCRAVDDASSPPRVALVLTSGGLQKWQLEAGEPDRLVYEADLVAAVRESLWSAGWGGESGNPAWLRIWLLHMSLLQGDDRVAVLVAAINQNDQVSQGSSIRVHYGLAVFRVQSDAPPISPVSFSLLNEKSLISEGEEPRQYKLLTADETAYIYTSDSIMAVNLNSGAGEEKIPLTSGDSLLGVGRYDEVPLLFTAHHGVVSVSASAAAAATSAAATAGDSFSLNDSLGLDKTNLLSQSLNITVSAQGLENLTMSESKTDQLKAAFLLFCKRATGQAQAIIDEVFPEEGAGAAAIDASLDRHVVSLCQDLLDDFPASDPRWVESLPQGGGGVGGAGGAMTGVTSASSSLLVLHQLEDKLQCHEFFIGFLKVCGLWARLAAVTRHGRSTPTLLCLAEAAEKNVAAITLRTIHGEHAAAMDAAMRITLAEREVTASGNLTVQDHFYREISRIDEILDGFAAFLAHSIRADSPRDLCANVTSVNTVVVTMLSEVLSSRNKKAGEYVQQQLEYLPWTAARREQLLQLAKLSLQHGLPAAENGAQRARLQQQVTQLADFVLDSYRAQMDSLQSSERRAEIGRQMEQDREQLIGPLVDRKLYEEAASLAEKYLDFDSLVRICEATGDKEKLESYMDTFSAQNFSEHVFAWYVKQGKQGRLLTATGRSKELARFLTGHSSISWLHDINTANFAQAATTLQSTGRAEIDVLARKKTQLSLAKLSALAAEEDSEQLLEQLDQDLLLVEAQEQIPSSVLDQFGLERANMRVLSPREMIQLYTGEENVDADHIDFKKALDLVDCQQSTLDREEADRMRLHIWAMALLRNRWDNINVDDPVESLKDTLFFRLVEFALMQGADLSSYLPTPQQLLEQEELGDLRTQQNFRFLLHSGYEHLQRVCAQ